jgi:hypothetical protein
LAHTIFKNSKKAVYRALFSNTALGITILNLRNRRSCKGNQNFTRFHMSMIRMMLVQETAKMVLPGHQLPKSPTKSKFPAKLLEL